jgi:hypothetical protein
LWCIHNWWSCTRGFSQFWLQVREESRKINKLRILVIFWLPRTLCIKCRVLTYFIPRFNKTSFFFADLTLKEGIGGWKETQKTGWKTGWISGKLHCLKICFFSWWLLQTTNSVALAKFVTCCLYQRIICPPRSTFRLMDSLVPNGR